jgi:CRISPR-associated protein Csm1
MENSLFSKYKKQIFDLFQNDRESKLDSYNKYNIFLKGDVSGIQDFIFSIKSKGASKSLKSRSHYIEILSEMVLTKLQDIYNDNFNLLYNGGGNFYCFLANTSNDEIKKIEQDINLDSNLIQSGLYISLSCIELSENDFKNFSTKWNDLHIKSSEDKLKKYSSTLFESIFSPFTTNQIENNYWSSLTNNLIKYNGFEIQNNGKGDILLFDQSYNFTNNNNNYLNRIINKLPIWSNDLLTTKKENINLILSEKDIEPEEKPMINNIIEFQYLSSFAKTRTGTDKLGVLKMDVDNLGNIFSNFRDINNLKLLSQSLKWFFDEHLNELLDRKFSIGSETDSFRNNLYVVFSGGDDCFILGAWDAIFEFAFLIRNEFEEFTSSKITCSASIIQVGNKFPVIQFARLAEDELKKAKNHLNGIHKNNISVFGEVISWDDYNSARIIAKELSDLILNKNESKTILDRIKKSKIGFEKLKDKAIDSGIIRNREIWRLFYFLRNSKNKGKMTELIERYKELYNQYEKILLTNAIGIQNNNPILFPVAARWAEFLTRKSKK